MVEKISYSGFNMPFGYKSKDIFLQIIYEEAEIVKYIYSLYLSGKS